MFSSLLSSSASTTITTVVAALAVVVVVVGASPADDNNNNNNNSHQSLEKRQEGQEIVGSLAFQHTLCANVQNLNEMPQWQHIVFNVPVALANASEYRSLLWSYPSVNQVLTFHYGNGSVYATVRGVASNAFLGDSCGLEGNSTSLDVRVVGGNSTQQLFWGAGAYAVVTSDVII